MRINKFVAAGTGLSRRAADRAIEEGRVRINGQVASPGHDVIPADTVTLDGVRLKPMKPQTVIFNKPVGYVTSRDGQGSKTIYDLVPPELHHLKPVGRLDKDSSGLLLLTNDGELAQQLTHPSFHKAKIYEIAIDKPLQPLHRQMISDIGIQLEDGSSKFLLERLEDGNDKAWRITMHEGRNRQIRRTFRALGYTVTALHRTHFGEHYLGDIRPGDFRKVQN